MSCLAAPGLYSGANLKPSVREWVSVHACFRAHVPLFCACFRASVPWFMSAFVFPIHFTCFLSLVHAWFSCLPSFFRSLVHACFSCFQSILRASFPSFMRGFRTCFLSSVPWFMSAFVFPFLFSFFVFFLPFFGLWVLSCFRSFYRACIRASFLPPPPPSVALAARLALVLTICKTRRATHVRRNLLETRHNEGRQLLDKGHLLIISTCVQLS